MPAKFDMSDYVPVNERIEAFKADWPEGSLQSTIVELTETRVTVKAYAYRTPDDQRPGIGHSSLEIPGGTPYTRGSEIENAETSAWGRAIAALGFEVKRGVASREEVRNKPSGQGVEAKPGATAASSEASAPVPAPTAPQNGKPSDAVIRIRYGWAHDRGWTDEALDEAAVKAVELTPMEMDSVTWQLFAATIKAGPTQGADETSPAAPSEPEEAATPPPARTTPRTVEEAIADAESKAKAGTA
jgi:hypothetical protein